MEVVFLRQRLKVHAENGIRACTAPAADPAVEPAPAAEPETYDEEFYDSYQDAAEEGPGRSGRSIEEDASLIPFNELMERLARERRSLNRGPQRRELPQAKDDDF